MSTSINSKQPLVHMELLFDFLSNLLRNLLNRKRGQCTDKASPASAAGNRRNVKNAPPLATTTARDSPTDTDLSLYPACFISSGC